MFCPQCKAEYRSGFTHCGDCDVDLVQSLPAEPHPVKPDTSPSTDENQRPGYVLLTALGGEIQAAQIRSFLSANGIETECQSLYMSRGYGLSAGAFGRIEILVPAEREAEARDLLEKVERGDLELPVDE